MNNLKKQFWITHFSLLLLGICSSPAAEMLFDMEAIRDTSTLETKVIRDWEPLKKNPSIQQKLIEITICEWWSGEKIRLPVILSAPTGEPCKNIFLSSTGLTPRLLSPRGLQLELLTKHHVGVVLVGMGTIEAMQPVGQLHLGMRDQLLKTKNVRYTPAWIWGMSYMRALTAACAESGVFQPERVLSSGGSKRGVATAVAGIHDDRFTAILPVVAPPLGNPGGTYVLGTEVSHITSSNKQFFADLESGKLGLNTSIKTALDERTERRARSRITLDQAHKANWSDTDIATITNRAWDASRVSDHLTKLRNRGTEIFYNVGTNDSVSPALLQLGKQFPDFPINIIPGGQHGGPSTAGFTRMVPRLPISEQNLRSFTLHHFFGARDWIDSPKIEYVWSSDTLKLEVTVRFGKEVQPQSNELWWSINRSEPYTLPFDYDHWDSAKMEMSSPSVFRAEVTLKEHPDRLDFLTVHTHLQNDLPLTISSSYQRVKSIRD